MLVRYPGLVGAALFLCFALGSCGCLDRVTLRPEISAADAKNLSGVSASLETVWEFKDCCPTDEQEATALRLQEGVADLWEALLEENIEVARYNQLVAAARDAIREVILVCSARGDKATETKRAWARCGDVADRIDQACDELDLR